ncbi:MAG: FAD:protein FMN transferase [Candidatus Sericytochromatia bacterium]|nr:FAD:protein FMN transferase [Candidatus Tanganyikabacteria bacterium]
MGTLWTVEVRAEHPSQALDKAFAEIRRLDGTLSTYKADSEMSALNRDAGGPGVLLSAETRELVGRAVAHARNSGGAFDPTVGALMRAWGFRTQDYRVPDEATLQAARSRVGFRHLHLEASGRIRIDKAGVELDLGAIGKGFAVDRALSILRQAGATAGRVDAGGNQGVFGPPPIGTVWQFGIRHPRREAALLGVLALASGSISTSGDAERGFWRDGVRYGHVVDPRTGQPVRDCLSVTVTGPSAEVADALSTTLYVLGPDHGIPYLAGLPGYAACWVLPGPDADHWRIRSSPGFPALLGAPPSELAS